MLTRFAYFFARLFGYSQARGRQRELQAKMEADAAMHKAASREASHQLSRLEREIQAAKDEGGSGS